MRSGYALRDRCSERFLSYLEPAFYSNEMVIDLV